MQTPPKLIRVRKVSERTCSSPRTIWRWLREDPTFPKPYRLSTQFVAWDEAEIDGWIAARKTTRVA
jgi:prophage regulatory protein